MPNCEVCGRPTLRATKIVVEGVPLLVCEGCRSLGEAVSAAGRPISPGLRRALPKKIAVKPKALGAGPSAGAVGSPKSLEELSVVPIYGQLIKRGREAMQLTPDELGRKIGEKASVIRKLEMGKLVPDLPLAKKLEHALKVKLLAPPETPIVEGSKEKERPSLTLGDVVRVKGKPEQSP